jgi:sulfofructose kinase
VDVAGVTIVAGAPSRFAVVIVERGTGSRTVLWHRDPRVAVQPGDVADAVIREARIVHGDDQDPLTLASVARRGRAAGARTVIDVEAVRPGVDVLLAEIDVVIATAAFAETYTGRSGPGEALAALQATCGAPVVCVTLGEEGSLARCAGHEIRTPGFHVRVADTTGAGDVFRAGFIAGWLRGGPDAELEDVLRYANAAAALACRAVGAMAAAPAAAEVEALLRGEAM